jgi:DNA-binding IclR family transcriptional regulator
MSKVRIHGISRRMQLIHCTTRQNSDTIYSICDDSKFAIRTGYDLAVTQGDDAEAKTRDGNQTLARGLRAMLEVANSGGMTVQQLSEQLGVHRSIAYRLMQTLADFGLTFRDSSGVYVPGARMATFADAYLPALRDLAEPVMRELADRLGATVLLYVEKSGTAEAVSIIEPTTVTFHIAFRPGMRTPLDRGAPGHALRAFRPQLPDEPPAVTLARQVGYARSHGEVRSGMYGVAATFSSDDPPLLACLHTVTYTEEVADKAGPQVRRAADEISSLLNQAGTQAG